MSQLVIPPGYAQVAFGVTNSTVGHRCVWTCGVKLAAGTWTPTQGAAFFVAVNGALVGLWDGAVTQTGFHALIGSDGPYEALDITGAITGSLSPVQMAPPNVTYLFKKTTQFAGRQYRGRLYLPFVDTTFLSENGALAGTTLTRMATAATNLLAAPGSGATTGVDDWVLLHRAEVGETPPAPTIITSFQPSSTVATQRRRLER